MSLSHLVAVTSLNQLLGSFAVSDAQDEDFLFLLLTRLFFPVQLLGRFNARYVSTFTLRNVHLNLSILTRRCRTCEVLELVLMWSPLPNRLIGTGAGGGHAGVGGMYSGGGDRNPPLYNNKHEN